MNSPGDIAADAFAQARTAARAQAAQERLAVRRETLRALHAARDAFAEASEAPSADGDLIEDLAGRIHAFALSLEPLLEALQTAREQARHRGPILTRLRSRLDPARLAALTGEVLAEELLSGPAAALLAAALRHESA